MSFLKRHWLLLAVIVIFLIVLWNLSPSTQYLNGQKLP